MYLAEAREGAVEALAEVPVADRREDATHRVVIELVDGDDLQVARETARDVVAAAARWTHRRHQQLQQTSVTAAILLKHRCSITLTPL